MASFRGIFPGAFTMGNLLCGFLAILAASNREFSSAAWFIILAAFLDGLDGRVARISRGTTQFGKELDSLADVISFGVAPAFLVHVGKLYQFGKWGFMVGAVFLMCGAFRLARYNVVSDPHKKSDFQGLPIPIAAVTIASYVILCVDLFGEIRFPEFLVALVIGCAGLMVSTVAYQTFPEKFDSRENRWRLLALFVFLVAVLIKPRLVIFPFLLAYVAYGLLREMFRMMTNNRKTEKEADDGG